MDEQQLNAFNQAMRQSPEYVAQLRSMGVNPDLPMKLRDDQRKQLEQWVRSKVGDIGDLEIDPAGNANQNEGFGKQLKKWGPIAAAAAITAFGIPGTAITGLLGGSGATGAAGAAGSIAAPTAAQSAAGIASMAGSGLGGVSGAGGFLSGLSRIAGNPLVRGVGSMLAGGSQAATQDRGAQVDAALAAETLNQNRQNSFIDNRAQREQVGMATGTDAMKKLQQSSYLEGKTAGYNPATLQTSQGARTLPKFGFGSLAATADEVTGANAMKGEAMNRLQTGNPIPEIKDPGQFQFDPKLLRPSAWERLSGLAGAGLSGWSALANGGR